ncbi:DUF4376 domain-containing protein [Tumebacillus sp. ITR2]|uniref:DUF4376 domain-containing protein n=1 Tax=Tumebacillus amylolyticus TaxID=2801339 RepID=A0ABS1JCJ5_9BACL|nr:DUF4376 domain-containing protein [Tumebacillus amylolyticus]MBL0387935.1 DUF4376 domain-containing protein [Tumebacillus amylolyticus]
MEIVYLNPATREPDENGVAFERTVTEAGAVVLIPVTTPPPPPSLEDIKGAKIAELNAACNTGILAGFRSSALGEPHSYDFDAEAQSNLTGMLSVMNADPTIVETIWKTTDVGPLPHTREQFVTLCRDGLDHKNKLIARYWAIKASVEAATSEEEVLAIQWEAGNGQGA